MIYEEGVQSMGKYYFLEYILSKSEDLCESIFQTPILKIIKLLQIYLWKNILAAMP